jgi:hypothetical protein
VIDVIDGIDAQLAAWVEQVVPGASVSFEMPQTTETADVGVFLMGLADMPPARGEERPPLQVELDYLVTTPGADVAVAHKRLGDLLFAAMAHADFDVRFPSGMAAFWSAAAAPPRPSFVLAVPLRQTVEQPARPPVRQPLVVNGADLRPLEGLLLGPGEVPVADAFVEMPALTLATRSDRRGRFRFAGVPATSADQQVRVRAKAREFRFSVDSSKQEPITLRLDLLEE